MLSIIIPFFNEEQNLPLLVEQLQTALTKIKQDHEIIFIDDGSTDSSLTALEKAVGKDKDVVVLTHRKQFGKGKALETAFHRAHGKTIVFMDADLQNDPVDLPRFLEKLDDGYDLVNGYRKVRNDGVDKTLPSKIYNTLIAWLFGLELHDINCGFKAMKREVLETIPLYGDNYRIVPILAKHEGFKIAEIEVEHHPRKYGVSKYGAMRVVFGLFDILNYYFLLRFFEKPIHFFGAIGSATFGIGVLILAYLGIERILFQHMIYRRPILFLGLLLVIVGVQIIATGFLGELIVYLNKKRYKDSKI